MHPFDSREKQVITKLSLYLKAMRFFIILSVSLSLIITVSVILFSLFSDAAALGIIESLLLCMICAGLLFVLFIVIGTVSCYPGIHRITKQEALLRFCFRDEMIKYGIVGTEHVSPEWFIHADAAGVIAFRKGFIIRIDKVEEFVRRSIINAKITVVGIDNKSMIIISDYRIIEKFAKWLAQ